MYIHVVLARGQQGSRPFDNLSAFRPCIFMNTLSLLDGDFGAFDESCSYNFVPNKRPHFLFFSKRPGGLKGRIQYRKADLHLCFRICNMVFFS